MFATGFVQTVPQFLLVRFITGLGLGGEWAVGHALIAESVPPETRARWSAFLQSGEPVGVALAAVVGFLVAPHIGWRAVFMLSAVTGFLTLLFRRFLSESPLWLQAPPKAARTRFEELRPFFATYWPLMILAFVLAVLKLGTYWTCYTWLPRFIKESFGLAIGKSALWFMTGQLGQFIGMYGFGHMADRVGRRWAFTLFSSLTAMALLSPTSIKQHFCVLLVPIAFCLADFLYRRRDLLVGTALILAFVFRTLTAKAVLPKALADRALAGGSVTWCALALYAATGRVLVQRARLAREASLRMKDGSSLELEGRQRAA
jgi:MFS family permease